MIVNRKMDELNFEQLLGVTVERSRKVEDLLSFKGSIISEHWRAGRLLKTYKLNNGITNAGKNYILAAGFQAGAQLANWYMGLIDSAGFAALAATDTMLSHPGWATWLNYSEATRQQVLTQAVAAQQVTSAAPHVFTMTAAGTLKGIFIVSDATKGGTAGTLWSTALYGVPPVVNNGDIIRNTYTIAT
jgi:hypothetical protein